MIHIHNLDGCAPTPLAHYLKALGILRLVSEDKEHGDANARGWWEGERFKLATTLDQDALENVFLESYEPAPMLAPWNGTSGFFRTWDAKKKKLRASKKYRLEGQIAGELASRGLPGVADIGVIDLRRNQPIVNETFRSYTASRSYGSH